MSKINRHPVRRTAAGVLAGALALSGAVAVATPASALPGFGLDRIAGEDRYETSARIAEAFGPSSGAILASGEVGRSVDALSANFLAGVQGVPVLLTQRDRVPASVMARLNALTGAKNVTIVGGTVAVSAAVETQLRGMGFTVTRLGGEDRYATSEAIITAGRASASTIGLVASGTSFPDALAGAPLSYKGKHPVFLTSGSSIPQDTVDAMVAAGTRSVIILGGTAAVPASIEAALAARGITVVIRLGGAGRSETSRIVADYLIANQGFTNTTFNLASGAPRGEGADALSGGALSGKQNRALLITDTQTQAAPVISFARDRSGTLNAVGNIFGGPAAVAVALEEAIEAAGRAAGSFQTLNVTPTEAVTLQLADETSATATVRSADNRTYTVSGLTAGTRYRITLVNAASIQGTGTNRTFLSSAIAGSTTAFGVDIGTDIADIVSVNGATPTNNGAALDAAARTATAVPVAGSITFEIDGTAPGTVVPAVYVDGGQGGSATTGGSDVRLETSATAAGTFAAATESFGLGGPTTYINPAAASGNFGTFAGGGATAIGVQSTNKGANQFDANGFTFTYDANDIFRVGGVPATLEEFEAALSRGDSFSASYSSTAGAVSTFELTNVTPVQPTTVAAEKDATNRNDITVTVTSPGASVADSVVIQRASVTSGTDEAANGTVGAFATIATVTPTAAQVASGVVTYVDNDVPVGTYRYRAALVVDGQTGTFREDANNESSETPAADTTAPVAIDTVSVTNAGLPGDLGAGDVFRIVFNENIGTPSATATLRLDDADTTVADLVNGSNATFAVSTAAQTVNGVSRAAGRVLTVTLTGAPTVVVAGTAAGVQLPADIVAIGGIADVAGNLLTTAGGQDLTIEAVGADTQNNSADTTPATVTAAAPAAGATSVVFTSGEALTAGSITTADLSGTATVTGVSLSADGTTITVTTSALTAGQTVTLAAGAGTDLAGNASPAAPVTATATA